MDWMRTKVENIKYCICVVLLILLDSCVNREITIMTEDKITYPQVENADLSEVLYADKLIVSDSFLVVKTGRQNLSFIYMMLIPSCLKRNLVFREMDRKIFYFLFL